jgi:hypothetical protein
LSFYFYQYRRTYFSYRLWAAANTFKTGCNQKLEQQETARGAGATASGATSQTEATPGKNISL